MLPNQLINGRYQILRLVGKGGMGAVYQATDTRLQSTVALKQLLLGANGQQAFEQEARLLASLQHPSLPMVSDYFSDADQQFLVMQYIAGDDLATLLAQRGQPFSLAEVLRWADQLLDTLSYLHQHTPAIIHRDIKPHNLKLSEQGQIVLLDFGLAKGQAGLTRASIFGYTPQYAPLEQIQGVGTGPQSDLYSLAATLFHLLCGTPPPDALSRAAAIVAKRPDPLPTLTILLPTLPAVVASALTTALALNPTERHGSAAQLRKQLQQGQPTNQAAVTRLIITEPSPAKEELDENDANMLLLVAGEGAAVAVEAERQRVAGQLQVQVIEPLSLLLAQTNLYEQILGSAPQARTAIAVLTSLARQVLQQARDFGEQLQPAGFKQLGLEPALELLANQLRRTHGVQVLLELERQRDRAPYKIELALFRLAQAAAERSIQQAQATMVQLTLGRTRAGLLLQISDNGRPNSQLEVLQSGFLRIQQLGGSCEVGNSPWGGMQLSATLEIHELPDLTNREREVLALIAKGQSNKAIALELGITPRTVGFHLDHIYAKLGVRSRTEAAIYALRYL